MERLAKMKASREGGGGEYQTAIHPYNHYSQFSNALIHAAIVFPLKLSFQQRVACLFLMNGGVPWFLFFKNFREKKKKKISPSGNGKETHGKELFEIITHEMYFAK